MSGAGTGDVMSVVTKAMYKPLSIATSVAGGLLAGAVFNQYGNGSATPARSHPTRWISAAPVVRR
jgi:hypothetical protein